MSISVYIRSVYVYGVCRAGITWQATRNYRIQKDPKQNECLTVQ